MGPLPDAFYLIFGLVMVGLLLVVALLVALRSSLEFVANHAIPSKRRARMARAEADALRRDRAKSEEREAVAASHREHRQRQLAWEDLHSEEFATAWFDQHPEAEEMPEEAWTQFAAPPMPEDWRP